MSQIIMARRQPVNIFRPVSALNEVGGEMALAAFEQDALQRFGSRGPLARLSRDRQRRIAELQRLCQKYQVVLPQLPPVRPISPVGWDELLRHEVELLVENLRLYNRLLEGRLPYADVERSMSRLRQETLRVHLPLLLEG